MPQDTTRQTPQAVTQQKNPRRVAAGRRNARKRGPLSAKSRERLRRAILRNKPWEHSTGPRTPEGKRRSAANADRLRKGNKSVRQLRSELSEITALLAEMRDARAQAERPLTAGSTTTESE